MNENRSCSSSDNKINIDTSRDYFEIQTQPLHPSTQIGIFSELTKANAFSKLKTQFRNSCELYRNDGDGVGSFVENLAQHFVYSYQACQTTTFTDVSKVGISPKLAPVEHSEDKQPSNDQTSSMGASLGYRGNKLSSSLTKPSISASTSAGESPCLISCSSDTSANTTGADRCGAEINRFAQDADITTGGTGVRNNNGESLFRKAYA